MAVARTWLSVRVELVSGRGMELWPRPGRILAAARSHTFEQLADAIDAAFARWDLAHLHMFTLADGSEITALDQWDGEAPEGSVDSARTRLSRLAPGEQFAYLFDFGDDWAHLCTVACRASTRSTNSGSSRPHRCRTSAGASCRISTDGGGTATTANHGRRNGPLA